MTQATDSTASATLSGREMALKRRKAMALHGKSGTAKAASVSKPSAQRGLTRSAHGLAPRSTGAASAGRDGALGLNRLLHIV
jgi:hypothetical protein